MSRNEAPTPILKLPPSAFQVAAPVLLPEISLIGQDSLLVAVEFSDPGAQVTILPWARLKGPVPGAGWPADPSDITEDVDIWVRLTDITAIFAEPVTANRPPSALVGGFRGKVVEFDCQGFDAVAVKVIAISMGEVTLWTAAKRRLY